MFAGKQRNHHLFFGETLLAVGSTMLPSGNLTWLLNMTYNIDLPMKNDDFRVRKLGVDIG